MVLEHTTVQRQSFWDRRWLKQEGLWLLWFVILCGLPTVQQAAIGDCLSFDPFPFDQNGLSPPEVDVGGRQVGDALVISQVIVVSDESLDLSFEIARQVIVLEQDTVLERLNAYALARANAGAPGVGGATFDCGNAHRALAYPRL